MHFAGCTLCGQPKWNHCVLWIWLQRPGWRLAQVRVCCLTVPSHYLNQCWLINSEVLWHSPDGNFIKSAQNIYPWNEFWNYQFKDTLPGADELKLWWSDRFGAILCRNANSGLWSRGHCFYIPSQFINTWSTPLSVVVIIVMQMNCKLKEAFFSFLDPILSPLCQVTQESTCNSIFVETCVTLAGVTITYLQGGSRSRESNSKYPRLKRQCVHDIVKSIFQKRLPVYRHPICRAYIYVCVIVWITDLWWLSRLLSPKNVYINDHHDVQNDDPPVEIKDI